MVIRDADEALAALAQLGAPPRLLRHHELVVEAAREIVDGLRRFQALFDRRLVLAGAAIHDAGKIEHPDEMSGTGNRHEVAGRRLLIEHGIGELARFCTTHAMWDSDDVELEDLLVALADKLWKGKRVAELERRVIERLASADGASFWDVFTDIDELFERVAARGHARLERSIP